jgi:hypothetical protein
MSSAPNPQSDADQLEAAADQAITACGGDGREAVKALITPNFQGDDLERIDEPEFIASIRAYRDKTEIMFRRLEGVRITIAKHEIPKTGKYQMIAEHPGYTRFDTVFTGSAYWQFTLKDDIVDVIQRRDIANEFLRITEDPEREETVPTKAGPKGCRALRQEDVAAKLDRPIAVKILQSERLFDSVAAAHVLSGPHCCHN